MPSIHFIILFVLSIGSLMLSGSIVASDKSYPDLTVSLPYLPSLSESSERGILINLLNEMDQVYEGRIIIKGIFPFKRSMHNVFVGESDFHLPILLDPDMPKNKLGYSHSTTTIFHVVFAIYTKKGRALDMTKLSTYNIEVERAHVPLFSFTVAPSSDIDHSLRMVNDGRIDAYIFAAKETDDVLIKLGLAKVIDRQFYKEYDVRAVLPEGIKGAETDKIISDILNKMKATGSLQDILSPINTYYQNWQSTVN